tara:strand:- start:3587 stop:4831 length:1245 start_codon:yes stop_codon:yes gene_type:complete
MKIKNNYITIYYFTLYFSLILGFFYGEDFAGGFKYDLKTHKFIIDELFSKSLVYGLLNYDIYYVAHSPLFIVFLVIFKNLFISEEIFRFVNLHIFLLIPLFIGLSLKEKFNLKNNDIRFLLPSIVFLSPYFRAGAIWTDDNILAIVFLSIAIFNFIKYKKNNLEFKYIIIFTVFFAFACYLRPIYCLFSIYFSLIFLIDLGISRKLIYYILINILLAFPAFYYVFILEINRWATESLFRENAITQISLVLSVIVFYFLPFLVEKLYENLKNILNFKNLLGCLIYIVILFLFFNYDKQYSGGIFYKISKLIFNTNYLFFLISSLSGLIFYIFFLKNKINFKNLDLVLLIVLFLLEIDGVIYHETYDPLIYILILLLFKNPVIVNFIKDFNYTRFGIILSFLGFFYLASIAKLFIV